MDLGKYQRQWNSLFDYIQVQNLLLFKKERFKKGELNLKENSNQSVQNGFYLMHIFCSLFLFIDFGTVETTWSRGSVAIIDLIYVNKYTPKSFDDLATKVHDVIFLIFKSIHIFWKLVQYAIHVDKTKVSYGQTKRYKKGTHSSCASSNSSQF